MPAKRLESSLPLDPDHGGARFPGFDVLGQAQHWDEATRKVVEGRLEHSPELQFFSAAEGAAAAALCDQLLGQRAAPRVPVAQMIDERLAAGSTDGWHYNDLAPDDAAWRRSLAALDTDAVAAYSAPFAECGWGEQHELLRRVQALGAGVWHTMVAAHVWSLWSRYACTAFYAHPWAWNEIGFAGPAYPRGYKNLGVDRLEPFEVRDARPGDDPVAEPEPPEPPEPPESEEAEGKR
ncbi:gluconate 2-dehydrogenase subunit 3 family protein [Leucobacter sp. HY1910]